MSSINKIARRGRYERGNAILEFAIAWSVLWAVFSGVYEFGYSFYIYNRLMTAVADAAQLGAKVGYDTGSPSTYTTKLKNMVVYGNETSGTSAIVTGLSTGNVSVTLTPSTGIPQYVTVSISSFNINALFGHITLTGKPRATVKYMGLVSCSTCT